jgi:hypothetical protein
VKRNAHGPSLRAPRAALGTIVSPKQRTWLIALLVLGCLTFYYVFLATAGTYRNTNISSNYYDQMCEGFRHGHLYVQQAPSAELLAKSNPFDSSNMTLWFWDACLYKRRYYLYWGPVPALLILLFKTITRFHGVVIDQWPTLFFMLGRLYAGAALIIGVSRHAYTRMPTWFVGLSILIFGLASPTPFIVARPHVYEACLAAGQCCLFWGLFTAFWGIMHADRRVKLFLLAGTLWALAIGSRVTSLIPVPLLVMTTLVFTWLRSGRSIRPLLRPTVALSAPVALAIGAYAVYNYLRFDSVFEFGLRYQVTLQRFFTNKQYIIPNIFSYLFAPVAWSCKFPFVISLTYRPLSPLITWPPGYQNFERVAGMFTTSYWTLLVVIPVWRMLVGFLRFIRSGGRVSRPGVSSIELWLSLCSIALIFSMLPALSLWEASMRYLDDGLGGVLLLSMFAGLWLFRQSARFANPVTRLGVRFGLVTLGLLTCFIGAFSGIATYYDTFKQDNPALYASLEKSLSVCK